MADSISDLTAAEQPTSGPQLSTDGRFFWDGARWAPVPSAVAPSAVAPHRLSGILVLVGGGLVVVGTMLPWLEATAPFVGTISRNLISGPDGQILAGLGVVIAVLGLTMLVRGPNVWMAILTMVAVAIAALTVVVDYQDISHRIANLQTGEFPIIASVGPGPYVDAVGLMAAIAGAVMGLAKRAKKTPDGGAANLPSPTT